MVITYRALNDRRFWRAFALVAAFGLFAIGCGGKGDSGGGFGVPPPIDDPEGDTPGTAVVIVPDGRDFSGAIDFGGDVDWFTFRAGEGIVYTLQIFGFPPDPFLLPENDLTGGGIFPIRVQIVSFDGLTQILNSTGTDAGEEYDTDPVPLTSATVVLGDSRITWVAPTTNDFFIRLQHSEVLTGRGHYVLHLSSSQLGFTDTGRLEWGSRSFANPNEIFNDDGDVVFRGNVSGGMAFFWDYGFGGGGGALGTTFACCPGGPVFFLDSDGTPQAMPETVALHIHWGVPNIFNPAASANFQNCGGDPHCWIFDIINEMGLNPEIVRSMIGFPWYGDVHMTSDFDTFAPPIAVSMPFGDVYSLFESELAMSESNVPARTSFEAQRGANPDFTLFYDASLKTLQIARRTYNSPFLGGLFAADAESFAGDILTVYARGSGGFNPVVGASVIPNFENPPTFTEALISTSAPGFRNEIKQLSGAEAEALRDAYYETGIYFEVTDLVTGEPISRADVAPLTPGVRSLEIQDVAFPQIIRPFRSSDGPLRKGIINFASDYAEGGQITVVSNGQVLGVLNDFLEEGQTAPECGEFHTSQSLAAEYWPHHYPYKAVAEDGTVWEGHFEIRSGACETLVLSVD